MNLNPEYFQMYDFILLCICAFLLFLSYRRGLFVQLYGLASSILSFYLTIQFNNQIQDLVHFNFIQNFGSVLSETIARYVLCFITIRLLFWIGLKIIQMIHVPKPISFINHLTGCVFGLVECLFIIVVWISICSLPIVENGSAYVEQSVFREAVQGHNRKRGEHQ